MAPFVPWAAVFGNDGRVEIEIGPGRGETLLAAAAAAPATNFFAVEHRAGAAAAVAAEATRRGLENVRVVAADVRCVLALVPTASVGAYHVYFPDPWPKNHHRHRRLASDAFAREVARTLVPGGALHLATDLAPLLEDFARPLGAAGLVRVAGAVPPSRPTTKFERKYAGGGTHYARFARASLR